VGGGVACAGAGVGLGRAALPLVGLAGARPPDPAGPLQAAVSAAAARINPSQRMTPTLAVARLVAEWRP
jgi:hypothetical protein